jgi:large subunit ribosomal protein L30
MAKVKITLVKGRSKRSPRQRATLVALGFKKTHQSLTKEINPAIQGQIDTVAHMLKIENI